MITYLSIGSNMGNKLYNLNRAKTHLANYYNIKRESLVYETEPIGYQEQEDFLNQVLEIETQDTPMEMLPLLQSIEQKMGKKTMFPNGPRTIDLDILLYGQTMISEIQLKVPHPRMYERRFVLEPLLDLLERDYIIPGQNETLHSLWQRARNQKVKPYIKSLSTTVCQKR